MEERKYVLIGGEIRSKSDGDLHYVSAEKLRQLYKLSSFECYSLESDRPMERDINLRIFQERIDKGELKVLGPRYDGNYELTTTN